MVLNKAKERARSYIYIVRRGYRYESPLCLIIYLMKTFLISPS